MAEAFTRLPVDGSGNRLHTSVVIELDFDGGTISFNVGDVVVGAISNVSAKVIAQTAGGTSAGTLLLLPSDPSKTLYADDEALLVEGTQYAIANGIGRTLHDQIMTIGSALDPRNKLRVDDSGAAYVRYVDGNQLVGTLGHSQITSLTPFGVYDFKYDLHPQHITTSSVGGGSVSHSQSDRSVVLSVDGSSGSLARISTRKYHKIFAQSGLEVIGGAITNNLGLTNNIRRAGIFDDNNGVFLIMSGTSTGLVLRSDVSGTPVDTYIDSSTFNGTSPSNGPLDITKVNQLYLDFNSIGRIRYGMFDSDGTRRVLHTIERLNSVTSLFAKTLELPFRVEVENVDTTAGTSELKLFDVSIFSQTNVEDDDIVNVRSQAITDVPTIITSSDHNTVTIRPKQTFKGITNRAVGLLDSVDTIVVGSSLDTYIKLRIVKNATLTSASWTSMSPDGAFEMSTVTGTYVPGSGFEVFCTFIGTNDNINRIDLKDIGRYTEEYISLDWDGTQDSSYTVVYDLLTGSAPPVYTALGIREVW